MADKQTVKVGDRITAKSDDSFKDYRAGNSFYVQETYEQDGEAIVVFEDNVGDKRHRRVSEFTVEHAPVADTTGKPAFTIETGKFYRTGDGRKVGPMEIWNPAVEHPWQQQGGSDVFTTGGDIWRGDGSSKYSVPDLIAEWVDEPASNDNAEPQKASAPCALRNVTISFDPAPTQPAIVALIENGQPKPSEQPKVHQSEQSATDEAERLAVKYPGQKFGVFVLADSRIADVVIRRAA